jgi:hypothetical protein
MDTPKAKEEVKNGVAYLQCNHLNTRTRQHCLNMLPLDRFGRYEGKCGGCGGQIKLSAWWLTARQREFKAMRSELRLKVERGLQLTIQEFDFVAKEHV